MSIRPITRVLLASLTIAVLSGCSANSKADTSNTTSTTAAVTRADETTVNLAKAGLFTQSDMGSSWKLYSEAKESTPPSGKVCLSETDKMLAELPPGARQTGPLMQYLDTRWYVGSSTNVFPDVESAKKYAELRKSDAGIECTRAKLDAEQKAVEPTLSIATTKETMMGVGTNGFELYTRYQLQQNNGDGAVDVNGTFDRYIYQVDNVVIAVQSDMMVNDTDPKNMAEILSNDLTRALQGSYARIQNR